MRPLGQLTSEPERSLQEGQHIVQFYEEDAYLVEVVVDFIAEGLREHETVVVIATASHRAAFLTALAERSQDAQHALGTGQLRMLDANDTLASFHSEAGLDAARFKYMAGSLLNEIRRASRGRRVRAYGEIVNLLWKAGKPAVAEQLEDLWNELMEVHSFSLLCTYQMDNFGSQHHGRPFARVCKNHSHVLPAESYARHEAADVRLRQVSVLQQQALALESEIDQRKSTEAALRDALRLRDEFLTIASHELRTPLTALSLQLQNLTSTLAEDSPDLVSHLHKSSAQVRRLAGLVDQLLDVTHMRQSHLALAPERVSLSLAVREVVDSLELTGTRGTDFIQVRTDEDVTGYWDPTRMHQVISNLLTNALKYGGGKPIEVHVARVGDKALLAVRDQGMGVCAQDQERIFGRFERAVSTSNFGGFGLGLWIVREIVEAHGGSVYVQSVPREGATFTVELPLAGNAQSAG